MGKTNLDETCIFNFRKILQKLGQLQTILLYWGILFLFEKKI